MLEEKPRLGTCLCQKTIIIHTPIMSFRIEVLSDDSLIEFFPYELSCGIKRSEFSHGSITY